MLGKVNRLIRASYFDIRYLAGLDGFVVPKPPSYQEKNVITYDRRTRQASYYIKTENPYESNFYLVKPRKDKVSDKSMGEEVFLL